MAFSSIFKEFPGCPPFFKAKPISAVEDKFPQTVRRTILDTLINDYPERPRDDPIGWAVKLTRPRSIKLNGITIHSDMSPNNNNRLIQIISHANSSTSDKRQHVASKLLDPLLWRRENPYVEMFAVVYDLSNSPRSFYLVIASFFISAGIFSMA